MPEVHSHYSPSASTRWTRCSASLHECTAEDLAIQQENQDLTAANRGTLGHTMVESILSGDWDYAKELEQDPLYDEELGDDVAFCYQWVLDNVPSPGTEDGVTGLEVRLESSLLEDFGGTMDVLRIVKEDAFVVDFKFGRGLVEADQNTQLLCYALLVYEHYPHVRTFTVTILQGGEAKTVVYSREDLDAFFQTVVRSMVETFYEAGDHCQYCPLKYRCNEAAAYVFGELEDAAERIEAAAVSDRPATNRIDDVVRAAKAAKLGKDIYEVASKVLKKWATEGIHLGDEAKVTTSNRKSWNDHAEGVLAKELGEQAFTKKLKTPAQIAKIAPGEYDNLIDTTPTQVLRLGKIPPEFD